MSLRRTASIIAMLILAVFVVTAGWLIWQQSREVHAPTDVGVCWRQGKDGRLAVFYRDIASIETCAALLEREHITGGRDETGAYQGRFIFVDTEAIRSAPTLGGERWRLYFDNQRAVLDRKLKIPEMVVTTQRGPPAKP
jgi:hypothetical protein